MRVVFSLSVTVVLLVSPLVAQEGYRLPPKEVVDIVDATPTPSVSLSPDGAWMLLTQGDALPPIADVSRRMLRLAGTRIDPAANSRFSTSFDSGLAIRATAGGDVIPIELPDGARLAGSSWSHDSTHFIYTLVTDDGSELWGGTVDAPKDTKRVTARLNTVLGGPQWMPDGASVLCRLVPNDRGDEPAVPTVPTGPNIQSTSGNASPLRTYQDLLASPHDADLFDHYAMTELWILPVASGNARHVTSGVISGASVSPDGEWILETTMKRPYSYLKPYYQFAQEYRARNLNTGEVKRIADVPSPENVPIEGVPLGPRSISWKSSAPATIAWVEALDGGDPKRKVDNRDAWFAWVAPFASDPTEILRTEHRARGLTWLEDPNKVLASEYDRERRWNRTTIRDLSNPQGKPGVIEDRSRNDRYGDPGRIVTERNRFGRSVPRQDGPWIYRSGSGASPEGSLPFLSRQNLVTLETERLWRSEKGSYESIVQVTSSSAEHAPTVVTRHETPLSPPNYLRRDLAQGSTARLTSFADPTPQIRGIQKKLVTYEREDGVPLSATLYLPANYQENTRLPLLVWAYPREFNDVKTAGQVSASPSRFTRIGGSSHLFLLTQGYAIMDGATMPIIGDPETMNDTFLEQLVSGAAAAAIRLRRQNAGSRIRDRGWESAVTATARS